MEYKILQDRILVHVQSEVLDGWVECNSTELLKGYGDAPTEFDKAEVHVKDIKKIPKELMERVLGTCEAYPHMEIGFVIYRNFMTGEWDIRVPEQNGAGATVSFFEEKHPDPKFQVAGSIHTHPEMGAFWSGTDMNTHTKTPGMVHWVFGLRKGLVHERKCSYFYDAGRGEIRTCDFDLVDLLEEEPEWDKHREPDPEWKKIIDKQAYRMPASTFSPVTLIGKDKHTTGFFREYWKDTETARTGKADKPKYKRTTEDDFWGDADASKSLLDDIGDLVAEAMYTGMTAEDIFLAVADVIRELKEEQEEDEMSAAGDKKLAGGAMPEGKLSFKPGPASRSGAEDYDDMFPDDNWDDEWDMMARPWRH